MEQTENKAVRVTVGMAVFPDAETADRYLIGVSPNPSVHHKIFKSPDGIVTQKVVYMDACDPGSAGLSPDEFRQVCEAAGAVEVDVLTTSDDKGGQEAAGYMDAFLDQMNKWAEIIPLISGMAGSIAKSVRATALRSHIEKKVADLAFDHLDANADDESWATYGKQAGKAAVIFADAMQNEIDLRELCDEELDEMESKPAE